MGMKLSVFVAVLVFVFSLASVFSIADSNIISSCRNITEPGNYSLNNSLVFNSGTCINVNVTGVNILGEGYTINYTGTVPNSDYAFYFSGVNDGSVSNLTVFSSMIAGVEFSNIFFRGLNFVNLNRFSLDFGGNYTLQNYLSLNVTPEDANVTITNNIDEGVVSFLSDSDGDVVVLTDYVNDNGEVSNYEYNIAVSSDGYLDYSSVFNMTESRILEVQLVADVDSPMVTLTSPVDNSSYNSNSLDLTFDFDVVDNGKISSCNFFLNDVEKDNLSSPNSSGSFSLTGLVAGNYNWSVSCEDEAGNEANSSVYYFVINSVATTTSSSSGGGSSCSYNSNFDWGCSSWGECVNGVQTRECSKYNNCGNTYGRPEVTQTCENVIALNNNNEEEVVVPQQESDEGFFSPITGAVTGALGTTGTVFVSVFVVAVIGGLTFVGFKARKKRKLSSE